jgi:ATP-dependent protease ClpP protease subunit
MTPETRNRAGFALTIALFAALGYFAWRSGRSVYETGTELRVYKEGGAVVFSWNEPVAAPMAYRLREAFGAWRARTDLVVIELDSPGGALTEGRAVIEAIERMKATHRVNTRVRAGRLCASMCAPIFLAGEERLAGAGARFMFHEPTSVDYFTEKESKKPAFERRMDAERFFERYFERSPMTPAWRERLREDWKGRDVWKSAEELVAEESGVVTRLER